MPGDENNNRGINRGPESQIEGKFHFHYSREERGAGALGENPGSPGQAQGLLVAPQPRPGFHPPGYRDHCFGRSGPFSLGQFLFFPPLTGRLHLGRQLLHPGRRSGHHHPHRRGQPGGGSPLGSQDSKRCWRGALSGLLPLSWGQTGHFYPDGIVRN
jgi:hypothetical protein